MHRVRRRLPGGQLGAILWLTYIYKALPLYPGFGFTSTSLPAPLHRLLACRLSYQCNDSGFQGLGKPIPDTSDLGQVGGKIRVHI